MDPAVARLIARLHQAPCRYVLGLTGGGASAAGWLLAVPGGSRTVLEVVVPGRLEVSLLPGEEVVMETHPAEGPFASFLAGRVPALCVAPDGWMLADAPAPAVVLPGSFNPLHEGHTALAEVAARLAGAP